MITSLSGQMFALAMSSAGLVPAHSRLQPQPAAAAPTRTFVRMNAAEEAAKRAWLSKQGLGLPGASAGRGEAALSVRGVVAPTADRRSGMRVPPTPPKMEWGDHKSDYIPPAGVASARAAPAPAAGPRGVRPSEGWGDHLNY